MSRAINSEYNKTKKPFVGGGEMGELMCSYDWDRSKLGPVYTWPQSLISATNIIIQSPAPLVILWGNEGITLYNDGYINFAGGRHPKLLGEKCEEIWPEAANFIRNVIDTCLTGESLRYERIPYEVYRNKTPENIWMDLDCSPIMDDNGAPAGVLIVNHEVTHLVKAEEEKKLTEEQLEIAMNAAGTVGTWSWDIKSETFYADKRFASLIGLSPKKAFVGIPITEAWNTIHPLDIDRVGKSIAKAISMRKKFSEEYRLQQNDGKVRWVMERGKCFYDSEGNPETFSGVTVDITERKLAEQALLASEQKLRRISDSNLLGIYHWNVKGEVFEANDAFLDIVRYSHNDLKHGKINWRNFIAEKYLNKVDNTIQELKNTGVLNTSSWEFVRKDGSKADVLLGGAFYEDSSEQGIAWVLDISERKKTEIALKKSENQYRAIAESMPQIVWTTKPDGYHDYYNKRWYDFVGKPFEETSGDQWNEQFHPDDQERAWRKWQHSLKTGEPYEIEYRLRAKDGKYRWFLGQALPFRDEHTGKIIRWFGTCTDIHDHKLSKEALAQSEEQFSSIFNQSFVGIAQTDLEGNFVLVNDRYSEITGYPKEVLYQESIKSITNPDDLEHNLALLKNMKEKGTPFKVEKRYIRPDGSLVWVQVNVSTVKDPDGKIIAVVVVCQDITEHKQAEEALRESEERFRTLADQSPMIVYLVEPDEIATMSYFNKAWLDYTGQTFKQAIGHAWSNIVHPDDLQFIYKEYSTAFQEKRSYQLPEVRLKRYDGTYRWHHFKGNPRYLPNGKFMGYIGVGIDIHEQKIASEQLKTSNAELSRINNDLDSFIYTASHDLKAPISNIEGLIQALSATLSEQKLIDDELDAFIQMINQSVERFKSTIKDLAEVAKVQSNTLEDNESEILLEGLLKEVKENIQSDINSSGAQLIQDFSGAPVIAFSRKNLRSIMYNLVSNAIKYRSPDRQVQVKITSKKIDNQHTQLIVEDNGLGIKEKNKEKIFSMFRRFHQHVEGTGIGLAIVKKIVDNNGGSIDIESEEGKGTTFKVLLKTS
ncbi:PAS domain S-box protein [Cytophagaceae bacterium ABcell3]|nr:PAS domain S-box protein [Cytophagaceae bacterium ABcell3]